jgi:polar amino acid transport system substrate-binding protein
MRKLKYLIPVMCLALLVSSVQAQEETHFRIATKLFPPLVLRQDDQFTGFSIQLWDAIAKVAGITYEWYEVETVTDQLEAVQNGEADAALAGITITAEREAVLDFSFPYFDSGLQIMIRQDELSPINNVLSALLSPDFVQFLLVFLLLIFLVANILWFIERRQNEYVAETYWQGMGRMIWWSAVTVIGYDDVVPKTRAGRVMALVWMFAGIFLIANLTASLSAGATVRELRSNINDLSDLRSQRVATVDGTTSSAYLLNAGIGYTGVETIEEAYELLRNEDVEAVVFDAPVLRYYIKNQTDDEFVVVGQVFGKEEYGIALPENSPHRETINRAILGLLEDGTYQQIYNRWFGAP